MKKWYWMVLAALVLAGCQARESLEPLVQESDDPRLFGAGIPESERIPGRLNVSFSDEMTAALEAATDEDGRVRVEAVPGLQGKGIISARRLFPDAGKFEPRTRAAGLHRWYILEYEESTPTTKAAAGMLELPGVDKVEYNPQIHIIGDPVVVGEVEPRGISRRSAKAPFDDPELYRQWHYYNNGTAASALSGCDINVFPAWRTGNVGSDKVIVAVVDGGIDFNHEDLSRNMWHNPEKSGDTRYGYNFVNDSYQVTADDHGTHVAGTIAAVNNNGKGVCGIAGGDAKEGEYGVQLMSCQIFSGKQSGSGAAAIKWAADHGAVISQNSWGYVGATTTPESLKQAVDYFIANAGIDEKGNQTGPMKGGIVIFAAGNENVDVSGNDYGPIFNVASVGADYRKAYYSCYGSWVDIAAPGGDVKKGNQVLSTLPGNRYGLMQGTSMACPHVSGVAALIVSKVAKNGVRGYTPDQLQDKLREGVTAIGSYNPNFKMGAGLVNAYRSLVSGTGKAPKKPSGFTTSVQSNNVHFSVTVPEDEDDGTPNSILVFYNKSDFTTISANLQFASFYVEDLNVGDVLEGTLTGLDFESEYYVAVAAEDLLGNRSALSDRIHVTTGSNNPPTIKSLGATSLELKPHQSGNMPFEVIEKDGHFYTLELSVPDAAAAGMVLDTTVRNMPKIAVAGPSIPSGSYTARLTVTDSYGLAAIQDVNYTILPNHAPVVVKAFEDVVFSSRTAGTQEINCADYFTDEDGEELSYTFSIDNETVVNMTAQGGKFYLTPMNYGYAVVGVEGSDIRGEKVSQQFRVLVRDGSQALDVYPNPIVDKLYIRTDVEADATVRIVSASGATVLNETKHISPFDPAVIDMSGLPAGVYTVIVTYGDTVLNYNVVKL